MVAFDVDFFDDGCGILDRLPSVVRDDRIAFADSAACVAKHSGIFRCGRVFGRSGLFAEYAPPKHRGKYCSLVPASTAMGLFAGIHGGFVDQGVHSRGGCG